MSRAGMALALVAGLLMTAAPPAEAARDKRPDIIVVMVDDMADGPAKRLLNRLPALKARFIDGGIHFSAAHSETPLCCPGRAGFLSGRHTHHHGVTQNHPGGFDQTRTIATALHDAGYWTALVGKYFNREFQLELPPPGWDVFESRVPVGEYRPDWIARRAAQIIPLAPKRRPMFMVVSSTAPHNESGRWLPEVSPVHQGNPACNGIGRWRPPNYDEADRSDKPAYTRDLPPVAFPDGWPLRRHCEALLSVDDAVRWAEDAQRARGRLDDTLWFFVADNGMTLGEHRWPFKLSPYSTPLPLWASWPAGRGTGPREETQHVSMIDLAPTLAKIGGAEMPWADGIAWSPLLRDEPFDIGRENHLESLPDGQPRPGMGLPAVPGWWGLRTTDGRWHYVEWATGERELYNLVADPWELHNVASDPTFGDVRASLADHLAALRQQ
jgi:arylsulfatase A-like enzyme